MYKLLIIGFSTYFIYLNYRQISYVFDKDIDGINLNKLYLQSLLVLICLLALTNTDNKEYALMSDLEQVISLIPVALLPAIVILTCWQLAHLYKRGVEKTIWLEKEVIVLLLILLYPLFTM